MPTIDVKDAAGVTRTIMTADDIVSALAAQTIATGPVAPGAASGTQSLIMGAQYNAADLAMAEGQQAALRMDPGGALRTSWKGQYLITASAPSLTDGQTFTPRISTVGVQHVEGQTVVTGQPVRISGITRTSNSYQTAAFAHSMPTTTGGVPIVRPHSIPEECWSYAAAAGGIVSSTADVVFKAAGAAGIRNYLEWFKIEHDLLSAAVEFVIKDGSTVIDRGKLQTPATEGMPLVLAIPLRTTAATALNFALLNSVTGGVYVNAGGYQAQ